MNGSLRWVVSASHRTGALRVRVTSTNCGQPGILATFQENRTQLERIVSGFGWSLDTKGIHVLSRSLVDMYIDEWVYELLDLVDKTKAKRIVIDSLFDRAAILGSLMANLPDAAPSLSNGEASWV